MVASVPEFTNLTFSMDLTESIISLANKFSLRVGVPKDVPNSKTSLILSFTSLLL